MGMVALCGLVLLVIREKASFVVSAAATWWDGKTLLHCGGSILPTAFHPGANFPGFAPVQLAAPALGPRQFFPPPIFYWPYPSPPVSPTSYYAPTMPPPGALPPQQPQQAMIPPDCIPLPPMAAPMPTIDGRFIPETMPRPEHEKQRPNFGNQYVELLI
ncbi:hypothetical protein QE152_g27578 [Popillia japonica]|uniref:Uncharacterized protein n=1 Tax=Popillia japonica TaxID=7064 RepID=A0AAW1JUC7_POPJA